MLREGPLVRWERSGEVRASIGKKCEGPAVVGCTCIPCKHEHDLK